VKADRRDWLAYRWLGLACLALSPLAHAVLGGAAATVETDKARMFASGTVQPGAQYTVHEMTLPRGTVVREFVNPAGVVFGVAWDGPAMPDLRQLLGDHLPEAASGVQAVRRARGGIGPVSSSSDTLVIQSGGHMGNFRGRAYLPQALPAGVSPDVIQ